MPTIEINRQVNPQLNPQPGARLRSCEREHLSRCTCPQINPQPDARSRLRLHERERWPCRNDFHTSPCGYQHSPDAHLSHITSAVNRCDGAIQSLLDLSWKTTRNQNKLSHGAWARGSGLWATGGTAYEPARAIEFVAAWGAGAKPPPLSTGHLAVSRPLRSRELLVGSHRSHDRVRPAWIGRWLRSGCAPMWAGNVGAAYPRGGRWARRDQVQLRCASIRASSAVGFAFTHFWDDPGRVDG